MDETTILLDTNIILERLFNRTLFDQTTKILEMEGQFCITSLSLQTVFYVAEAGFKKDTIFVQNQQNNFSVIR